MSKPRKIFMERLPKRDAATRLRAAYACLERGWRARRRDAGRQSQATSKQEEVS